MLISTGSPERKGAYAVLHFRERKCSVVYTKEEKEKA